MIYVNIRSGKSFCSSNKEWKYLKQRIKCILDETQSSKLCKIYLITSLLEQYKNYYLRGEDNEKH